MKSKVPKMEVMRNTVKIRTMLALFALLVIYFSTALAQKDTSGWTPPQTIYPTEHYSDSLSEYWSSPAAFAWDLSGNWHGLLRKMHRNGPTGCPSYAEYPESLFYINSIGVKEFIAASFYTTGCYIDSVGLYYWEEHGEYIFFDEDGAIAVDGSGTVHVTYGYYNYDTDKYEFKYTKRKRPKEWTFMIYMDADNNLEHAGILDMNEMEKVGSSDSVNIVVQMDRIEGFDSSNGNWTGTKRFFVIPDSDPNIINSFEVEDLGELNMGDPATLDSFVTWAKREFPAKKYCLVLWDHGAGWQKTGRGL